MGLLIHGNEKTTSLLKMNAKTWMPLMGLVMGVTPVAFGAGETPTRWMVSTTDVVPTGPATDHLMDRDDACLFQVTVGVSSHTFATRGNWFAMAGFEPADIDAVAFRASGANAAHRSGLVFSLLSDESGWQDGDVLALGLGGTVERVISEDEIAMAMGVPGAALDLAGLDFDAQGRLVFSLQADVPGTMLGDVSRSDVLRMEGPGAISRVYTEGDVQFAMDMAAMDAGESSSAIGDVHGIAVSGDDVFVVVQSPTALDGAVLRLGLAPAFVANEAAMGLDGAELDALAAIPDGFDVGAIALNQHTAIPGTLVHGQGHGFTPGSVVLLMMVGDPGPGLATGLLGFGELLVSPVDMWWVSIMPFGAFPSATTDGMGSFALDFSLPNASQGVAWAGTQGWSFQALDLGNMALCAPFRVQVF